MNITIKGVEITLKFSYSFLRQLAFLWKLDDVQAVFQKALSVFAEFSKQFEGLEAADLENKTDIKIPFDVIDLFVDFVQASAGPDGLPQLDRDDIAEHLIQNPGLMTELLPKFLDALPKPKAVEAEGKQEPAAQPESPNP